MKNRRKRQPKDSEPDGLTKAHIVLYLLDGEKDRTEISEYMKTQLNIINKTNIKNHLYDLVEMGIIIQGEQKPGKPRPYSIKKSFDDFKKIFNFTMDNALEQKLLETQYAADIIEAKDFPIKLLISIIKEMYLYELREMLNNDTPLEELKKYEDEINKLPIIAERTGLQQVERYFERREAIKKNDKSSLYVQKSDIVRGILENNTVDQLYEGSLKIIENIKKDKNEPSEKILQDIASVFIPTKDVGRMIAILKMSPSASEHILNIEKHNPITFFGLLSAYIGFKQQAESQGIKIESPSPIVTLLESAYRIDYADGKIKQNDLSLSIFQQLYIPNIEGDKE